MGTSLPRALVQGLAQGGGARATDEQATVIARVGEGVRGVHERPLEMGANVPDNFRGAVVAFLVNLAALLGGFQGLLNRHAFEPIQARPATPGLAVIRVQLTHIETNAFHHVGGGH